MPAAAHTRLAHAVLCASFALECLAAAPAAGRAVTVPVRLEPEFLRQLLIRQVYTGPGASVRAWDDGSGCNFLVLSDPRVAAADGNLRVISDGHARIGTALGTACVTLLDWQGRIEVDEQPSVDAARPIVRFRVVDSHLYAADGGAGVTGTLWNWVKASVHPRLEAVTVDLHQPLEELRGFLPLVVPAESAAQTRALLDSVRIGGVAMTDAGLRVEIGFALPEPAPMVGPPAPEPALEPEELAAWEAAWHQWDAFITFVAMQSAGDSADAAERAALFDVLIDARYDLVEILTAAAPQGEDPVRPLFLRTWERLAPVLRRLSLGLPGEEALRYLSFIAAADALQALDALGPDGPLDVSADGLRRMARMIAPAAGADPLAWSEAVDPRLRELFGFGPPLPAPADNPDVDVVALGWLLAAPAWAASDAAARLNHWVPSREDLPVYLPLVRDLLVQSAADTLATKKLDDRFHPLYRWLVLATAWKESCWRQFVRAGGRIAPMRSSAGAVGIMQVLPRVWRGFYDVKGLQEDVAYNARAGSEILVHYLRDHAIAKGEHTATGELDNLARATYAAYNGGPGHLRRYRKEKVARSLRRIDDSFWEKYLKVKKGNELAVAECFGP